MNRLGAATFSLFLTTTPSLAVPDEASNPVKPVIAINMWMATLETSNVSMSVNSSYVDAVIAAGGIPVILPPLMSESGIDRYVEMADGFLFVGGRDINPALYGAEPHETWNPENTRREAFDLLLMEKAIAARKPILAVCLGMQELNVVTGGTLVQDIPSEAEVSEDHRPAGMGMQHLAHDIEITEGTLLHRLMGSRVVPVNSLHHQACDATGPGTLVAARSPEGIVEAIELKDHPFAIGVQWHPEAIYQDNAPQLALFLGLVRAAKGMDPVATIGIPVSSSAEPTRR